MQARNSDPEADARARHALNLRPACPVGAAKIIQQLAYQTGYLNMHETKI